MEKNIVLFRKLLYFNYRYFGKNYGSWTKTIKFWFTKEKTMVVHQKLKKLIHFWKKKLWYCTKIVEQ